MGDTIIKTNFLYHKNGDKISTIRYKNNKIHGIKEDYYLGNRLKSITPYEDGKKNGVKRGYYTDGTIQYEIQYKNNKLDGEAKYYYKLSDIKLPKQGSIFPPSLGVRVSTPYKNGKKHGIETYYSISGKIQAEITYKYGKKIEEQLFENKE